MVELNKKTAEEIYDGCMDLSEYFAETESVMLKRVTVFQLKAKQIGIDLFESKKTFLKFIGYLGDKVWNAGLLEPVDNLIVEKGFDVSMTIFFGKDWFEKVKAQADKLIIVDNRIVEKTA